MAPRPSGAVLVSALRALYAVYYIYVMTAQTTAQHLLPDARGNVPAFSPPDLLPSGVKLALKHPPAAGALQASCTSKLNIKAKADLC